MPAGSVLTRARRAALVGLGVVVAMSLALPERVSAAATWTRNLYVSSGFLYQDPDYTACVAASVMMMLNFTDLSGTGGAGFIWDANTVRQSSDPADVDDMTSVLAFARTYDTLSSRGVGSDAHGWRNALNAYGWGVDPAARDQWVYDDRAYTSFTTAVNAAVRAIARFDKPVGILTSTGAHAQVMTGYTVVGEDPRWSTDFTVTHVYLSDPLRSRDIRNLRVSITAFREGSLRYRFRRYYQTDSPKDDPYSSGWKYASVSPTKGSSEWYGRWVIVMPVKPGRPRGSLTTTTTADPVATP